MLLEYSLRRVSYLNLSLNDFSYRASSYLMKQHIHMSLVSDDATIIVTAYTQSNRC